MIDTAKAAALADEEKRQIEEHKKSIGKVAKEIEEIFIREHFTMGDLLEVFGLFTERANRVFAKELISAIKKKYENL
jgi:hypothetical protein